MRLDPQPFEKIACGHKTIELRLNDEKRRAIQVGDTVVFSDNGCPTETVTVRVIKLHRFSTFAELYASLPLDKCGYLPEELPAATAKDMEVYYSLDRQKQFGVLGIEMQVVEK